MSNNRGNLDARGQQGPTTSVPDNRSATHHSTKGQRPSHTGNQDTKEQQWKPTPKERFSSPPCTSPSRHLTKLRATSEPHHSMSGMTRPQQMDSQRERRDEPRDQATAMEHCRKEHSESGPHLLSRALALLSAPPPLLASPAAAPALLPLLSPLLSLDEALASPPLPSSGQGQRLSES